MLSRIFWVGLAGIALVTGIMLQDGDRIVGWASQTDIATDAEQAIEARVERAVEGSFDQMQVVGPDGQEIDVPARTKRELGAAVSGLIKAETDLALARIRDASEREVGAANARRDRARAEVDRLKAEIDGQEQATPGDRDRIRTEIREDIRATIRDAVGN